MVARSTSSLTTTCAAADSISAASFAAAMAASPFCAVIETSCTAAATRSVAASAAYVAAAISPTRASTWGSSRTRAAFAWEKLRSRLRTSSTASARAARAMPERVARRFSW